MVLVGVGLGVGQPLTMSWLASSAPPGLRGRAMSLRLVGNRAGQVAIPSLAVALAAGAGAAGVLCATAACLVAIGVATCPSTDPAKAPDHDLTNDRIRHGSRSMTMKTADLYDEQGEALPSCHLQLRQLGARTQFEGWSPRCAATRTTSCSRPSSARPGRVRVLVVDDDGSLSAALMGDLIADLAAGNG